MKSNLVLLAISTILSFVLTEVTVRYFWDDGISNKHSPFSFNSYDFLRPPNSSHTDRVLKPNGEVLFDFTYNFDNWGRRVTQNIPQASDAALFFGGSYVFGDGIPTKETLPWVFTMKSGIQSYNYAYSGYGPHSMLALLKKYNLNEHIPHHIKKVDAFFFSYGFHIERYMGSFGWVGRNSMVDPYFKVENKNLVFLENFAQGRTALTITYWLLYYSKIFRIIFENMNYESNQESAQLLCAIINNSAQRLRQQLKNRFGTFYFVVSPFQKQLEYEAYYEEAKNCFNVDIKFLFIESPQEYLMTPESMTIHPKLDPHPNGYANNWLADTILAKIRNKSY